MTSNCRRVSGADPLIYVLKIATRNSLLSILAEKAIVTVAVISFCVFYLRTESSSFYHNGHSAVFDSFPLQSSNLFQVCFLFLCSFNSS